MFRSLPQGAGGLGVLPGPSFGAGPNSEKQHEHPTRGRAAMSGDARRWHIATVPHAKDAHATPEDTPTGPLAPFRASVMSARPT